MPAPLASVLFLTTLLAAPVMSPAPQATTPSAETPVPLPAPVPLPDPALSDSEYREQLTALLADPLKRPGVYTSLATYLDPTRSAPAHTGVIVDLLALQLDSPNLLERGMPLRLLGRAGASAQPLMTKVLPLANSPLARVRFAAVEALGGMYSVAKGQSPTAPPGVTTVLLNTLQNEREPVTRRAAAVALGRTRVVTPEIVSALAAAAGGKETTAALGALAAAENIGPDARLMLPAITRCMGEPDRVNNAVPALYAVVGPQEAIHTIAQLLETETEFKVRRTLLYYAEQTKKEKSGPDVTELATAVRPLLQTATAPSANDAGRLRLSAARAYFGLTGDTKTASGPVAELMTDTQVSPDVRTEAVAAVLLLGPGAVKDLALLGALNAALADSDRGVQNTVVDVLFKYGGPATALTAPRLSELLMTAWQNKETGRVYQLINALYRIGPAAGKSATPVLKTIQAKDPKGSANARFAGIALERLQP